FAYARPSPRPACPPRRSSDLLSPARIVTCRADAGASLRELVCCDGNFVAKLEVACQPIWIQSTSLHRRAHRAARLGAVPAVAEADRKSTRLNSSHVKISYAVF